MSRIITAAIVLPFLIVAIIFPFLWPLFVALAITAMCFALYEFWLLAGKRGFKTNLPIAILFAAALFVAFFFDAPTKAPDLLLLTVIGFTIAALIAEVFQNATFEKLMGNAAVTLLGVLYIVLLGGHLVALRMSFADRPYLSSHLLAFFFLVLMGSDTGAYYVGRTFGKHKLAPKISPGKTWEGAFGGLAAALLLAAVAKLWFFKELPWKFALPLAAVMTVLGILGDLTESALKRGAGAKDAASLLPGHGGLLDRLDSLLFNAPLIYYFARSYFG
jgi:phosphatidate cytidylyltransferase